MRRWRSAGVSDRWQRMMGEIEASWRQPRVYAMRVRRCMQRWSQRVAQIPLHVRLRATGLLARRARGKQAEAWRQWRAEAQHRAASRRIKERTRRVHTAAFKAHGGSALQPPSFEQQYPWTEWARQRRQSLEGALSRWQEEAQRQAQRLEAQQSLRGLGEGHACAGWLQGLGARTSAHHAAPGRGHLWLRWWYRRVLACRARHSGQHDAQHDARGGRATSQPGGTCLVGADSPSAPHIGAYLRARHEPNHTALVLGGTRL